MVPSESSDDSLNNGIRTILGFFGAFSEKNSKVEKRPKFDGI